MADNSLQGGTDSIRDIDRSGVGTGPKTQVFQVDHAGAGAVAESLTSNTNPFPVKLAVEPPDIYLLGAILTELKVISTLLQVGLNVSDDPGTLRDDILSQIN